MNNNQRIISHMGNKLRTNIFPDNVRIHKDLNLRICIYSD